MIPPDCWRTHNARLPATWLGLASWSLRQQAALHYCASRCAQAIGLLRQSLLAELRSGHSILNWLWLALANHRLGKAEEARRWLDESIKG